MPHSGCAATLRAWPAPGPWIVAGRSFPVIVAALLGSVGWGWYTGGHITARIPATVIRVVDGDTVIARFADGARARRSGCSVSTRPKSSIRASRCSASGTRRARSRSRSSPAGACTLELDAEQRDKYGRLLAYVHRRRSSLRRRAARARLRALPRDPAERIARPRDAARGARGARRGPRPLGRVLTDAERRASASAVHGEPGGRVRELVRQVRADREALRRGRARHAR